MSKVKMLSIDVFLLLLSLSANIALSKASYVPDKAPVTLCRGHQRNQSCSTSQLRVFVNRLNTANNILPYKYDDFDFCEVVVNNQEGFLRGNVGQILLGDRIQVSEYALEFDHDTVCKKVCKKTYDPKNEESMQKLTFLKFAIDLEYHHHWIVDNMPVAMCYKNGGDSRICIPSFPIGYHVPRSGPQETAYTFSAKYKEKDTYYVFNHIDIYVQYHPKNDVTEGVKAGRIVKVEAVPRSIKHETEGPKGCDSIAPPLTIPGKGFNSSISFHYSYSVYWMSNTLVPWSSRWDFLLNPPLSRLHVSWFSLFNSLLAAGFLFGMVALIFLKQVTKASIESQDYVFQDQHSSSKFCKWTSGVCFLYGPGKGWTLIDGDVFRPPQHIALLSAFISNGIQLTLTTFITVVFAVMGFLSPANQGALFTCFLIICICCSPVSGFVSARMYKNFGGVKLICNILLTVFLCPGLIFITLFLLNCILYSKGSSAAVPMVYSMKVMACWFVFSLPLTFIGAYCGNRRQALESPIAVNESPRPIPRRRVIYSPYLYSFIMAAIPFGCICIQLFFILSTVWRHEAYYYQFFPLLLMLVLLVITCAENSIILRFRELQLQDYHWWWRSFLDSGWLAIFVFSYCIFFLFKRTKISDGASIVLYFGFSAIFGFLVFLASGSIGFFASRWLIYKIYSRSQAMK